MSTIIEQIQEYESQLADVEALLQSTPDDPSIISLKNDLVDLINITKQQQHQQLQQVQEHPVAVPQNALTSSANVFDRELEAAVGMAAGHEEGGLQNSTDNNISFAETMLEASNQIPNVIDTTTSEPAAKKAKSFKTEFEVPQHLIPLETDTEAERNKKQRALKALKSKWRESKKEMESANKQKSWQSFQKKAKIKSSSIFKTGEDAAVGVVSAAGRQLTDYASRKRHKHEAN
jgi:survival of motor neuron-related-splicing factor 30